MKALRRSSLFIVFLAGWLSAPLSAQTASVILDTEAAQHVGQKATVEGVVTAVTNSGKGNTFINFGGRYPNQTFTGWIPKDSPLAGDSSLSALEGKKVRITGIIDLYKGKPEIKIMSKDQVAKWPRVHNVGEKFHRADFGRLAPARVNYT
jgi:DNA/RNA endonuclease YhcR with UshA esterase domain